MHYLKEIFKGEESSSHAHGKFVRYSRGEFKGPLVNITIKGKTVKLNTSFHCVDEVLLMAAERVGDAKVHVKGKIIWNEDLEKRFNDIGASYSKLTKSRGIYKYELDNEVSLKSFLESFWNYKLLLTFKTDDVKVSCKKDFPKPDKEFTGDFCKAEFPLDMKERVLEEFAFDLQDHNVKSFSARNMIEVDNVALPSDVSDFKKAREQAKREGKIKRYISVDGGEEKEEVIEFSV